MSYDYFYNQEAEQYIYYTLPKLFFEDETLKKLSINAKFLYSILLDRAKSSYKNGFIDMENKVYVHYAQSKMMKLLHVERTQLYKYLNELDVKKGIGLIERKQRLGKGQTDIIYVKNFAKPATDSISPTSDTKYKYFCDDVSVERFKYYSLPKIFFYDVDYAQKNTYSDDVLELQGLSGNAKMAYAYFLELLQLSMSKGKKDECGRFYIICPEEDLQNLLGCCLKTVRQILSQLDTKDGIGLIERSIDNPAIIYVLDYTVRLSLNTDPKRKKSEHQKEKSEHQKEKSEHQQEKSEHQQEKSEHQQEKSEHPIYNNPDITNPDFNNTDFNDTDFNLSVSPAQTPEQNDRPTDRLHSNRKMTFSDILSEIGISDKYIQRLTYWTDNDSVSALSEKNLSEIDIDERKVKSCTIPYTLSNNAKAMEEALEYLFGYSWYSKGMEEKENRFFNNVISSIAEIAEKGIHTENLNVKYYQVIDKLNDILHDNTSTLTDWFESFSHEWVRILLKKQEQRKQNPAKGIGSQKAYMKSCIWNWLNDYQFEEDNDLMALDYSMKSWKSAVSNDGFNADEYECCINNFPESITNDDSKTDGNQEALQPETSEQKQPEQPTSPSITEYREYREDVIESIYRDIAKKFNKPISSYLPKGTYKILGNDGNYYVLDDNGEYCPFDEKIGVSA